MNTRLLPVLLAGFLLQLLACFEVCAAYRSWYSSIPVEVEASQKLDFFDSLQTGFWIIGAFILLHLALHIVLLVLGNINRFIFAGALFLPWFLAYFGFRILLVVQVHQLSPR